MKLSRKLFFILSLFSVCALRLSAQVYTQDIELQNLLEMKTIVIRLSESLTLRENLLSKRESDWSVREKILIDFETDLNEKEATLKEREDLIKPIEKIYSDLNTSLTRTLNENKAIKTALIVSIVVAITEGIIIAISF